MTSRPTVEQLSEVIDERARPAVRGHLGDVSIQKVDDDGVVHFAFTGACERCGYRKLTLLGPLLAAVSEVPGVTGVACEGVSISPAEIARFLRMHGRPARGHLRVVEAS